MIDEVMRSQIINSYEKQQDGSLKFEVQPPTGTDGCVLFVEQRRPQSQQQTDAVVKVQKKRQGANAGFIASPPTQVAASNRLEVD